MVAESNSKHVEHFALHPLGAWPQVGDRVNKKRWVGFNTSRINGRIQIHL